MTPDGFEPGNPAEISGPEPVGSGAAFRRRRQPVPVRQPRWRRYFRQWLLVLLAAAGLALGVWSVRHWLLTSPDFQLASLSQIQVQGARQTTSQAIRQLFAADLGRNLLAIPLSRRQRELDRLPWIQQAAVMRIWPNRLAVKLTERQPLAFARQGAHLSLIAGDGALLPIAPDLHFQGAVLTGLAGPYTNAGQALRRRQQQLLQFLRLRQALDAGKGHILRQFSEIDLGDPRNLRVLLSPAAAPQRALLLQLGNRHFRLRFQLYRDHIQAWLAQYPGLRSIDLRYDGEAILNTGVRRAVHKTRAFPHRSYR